MSWKQPIKKISAILSPFSLLTKLSKTQSIQTFKKSILRRDKKSHKKKKKSLTSSSIGAHNLSCCWKQLLTLQ